MNSKHFLKEFKRIVGGNLYIFAFYFASLLCFFYFLVNLKSHLNSFQSINKCLGLWHFKDNDRINSVFSYSFESGG